MTRRTDEVGRELDTLTLAWARPPGLRSRLAAVNHKIIGMRFIVTGLVFFLVGGVLALLMRTQLAVPENEFLNADIYNQFFTMHGTTMMFLFAVPILEGLGIYLLPLMLGTRDLPFPRLNAFGYWLYLFGGVFTYTSFLAGQVPSQGWFAYVPLSSGLFSPDMGMDFWLLGITMVEISGILGALELVVVFLRRRAPGMTLSRIPLFGWSIFVTSWMMLLAFPVLVAASTMLELERTTDLVFFDPALGGEPLLWQHLFWFFGHPEVYIMLLPAVGMVSMVVAVFSQRAIAAYGWVVGALIAVGIASFGLWVHHMFTVGLPSVAMAFFAAASVLIAIPSGILVFSWLATMWHGTVRFKPPLLFVIGFLVIFVLGGITGVMVASVPFDTQVHDSFFVVAHFHYVLLGGVVFPVFAALYYWFPKFTGRMTSDRLGTSGFWLMFVGVNLAFFPQHFLGLQGMPRRVFTYEPGLGWELGNILSTIGAFTLAAGIAVAIVDFLTARRSGPVAGPDPWTAHSLEWATDSPPPSYNFREIPVVAGADPLWAERPPSPDWSRELAAPPRPVREVVDTSPIDATAEEVVALPGPSLWPLWTVAAITVALAGVLVSQPVIGLIGAVAIVACLVGWAAGEPGDVIERDLLPGANRSPIGVWGLGVGLVAIGAVLASLVFAHVYLMAVAPDPAPVPRVDGMFVLASVVVAAAAAAIAWLKLAGDRIPPSWAMQFTLLLAVSLLVLGGFLLGDLGEGAESSAQASSLVTLTGLGLLGALFLAGGLVATMIHLGRRSTAALHAVAGVRVFSLAVAGGWLVIAAVLTLTWVW